MFLASASKLSRRGKRSTDKLPFALIVRSTPMVFDDQGRAHHAPQQTVDTRGRNRLTVIQRVDRYPHHAQRQ